MTSVLILGSSSPYRATALRTLGLEFRLNHRRTSMKVRERAKSPTIWPFDWLRKKHCIWPNSTQGPWSLAVTKWGSATTALLSKPGTQANAIQSLRQCSGKVATFYTALALARSTPGGEIEIAGDIAVTELKFRSLTPNKSPFMCSRICLSTRPEPSRPRGWESLFLTMCEPRTQAHSSAFL